MEYEWRHSALEGASRPLKPIQATRRELPPAPSGQAPSPAALRSAAADKDSTVSDYDDKSLIGDASGAALSGSSGPQAAEDKDEEDSAGHALPVLGLRDSEFPALSKEIPSNAQKRAQQNKKSWEKQFPKYFSRRKLQAEWGYGNLRRREAVLQIFKQAQVRMQTER